MRIYSRKSATAANIVAPIIMMFMGLMIFIMSSTIFAGFSMDGFDDVLENSTSVKAKLVDEEEAGIYNSIYDFVLEYEVDGEIYYYTETNWSGSKPTESDIVSVMIDPENPEKVLGISRSSGLFAGGGDTFGDITGVFKGIRWTMMIIAVILFLVGFIKLIKAIIRRRRAGNNQIVYDQTIYSQNTYTQDSYDQHSYKENERTYNLNGETYNSHGEKID